MAEARARPYADVRLPGDGFVLRAWRADDLDALRVHADDPLVPRGLSDRFPHPYTRADGEAFLPGTWSTWTARRWRSRSMAKHAAESRYARAKASARTPPSWVTGWGGATGVGAT